MRRRHSTMHQQLSQRIRGAFTSRSFLLRFIPLLLCAYVLYGFIVFRTLFAPSGSRSHKHPHPEPDVLQYQAVLAPPLPAGYLAFQAPPFKAPPPPPQLSEVTRRAPFTLLYNKTFTQGGCYSVGSGTCANSLIGIGKNGRLLAGAGARAWFGFDIAAHDPSRGRFEVRIRTCGETSSQAGDYVTAVQDGMTCYIALGRRSEAVPFVLHDGYYLKGHFTLEMLPGHLVTSYLGRLRVEEEDSDRRPSMRRDASWRLLDGSSLGVPQLPEGQRVFYLRPPEDPDAKHHPKVVSNDPVSGTRCDARFGGCCWPRKVKNFSIPKPGAVWGGGGGGGSSPTPHTVVALVVSSQFTFAARRKVLEKWLFDPHTVSAVAITLDCAAGLLDEAWAPGSAISIDWLIGPTGPPMPGLAEVTVRVLMAIHWVFTSHRNSPWYLMVDDDTLVYPRGLSWALNSLKDPMDKVYYVGHTSEWMEKVKYHGDMAFGGGGSVFSGKAAELWRRKWDVSKFGDGTGDRRAVDDMLRTGRCTHAGGDGAACRCMLLTLSDVGLGEEEVFVDWLGFHQFDIVGTKEMLRIVRDTCPKCPSLFQQTGPWVLDVVGSQPVVTLHHLFATQQGSIYPGSTPQEAMARMYNAYDDHPGLLPLRRHCGVAEGGLATVCINFGVVIQVFDASLDPASAMSLLEKRQDGQTADTHPAGNATDKLVFLALRAAPAEAQRCCLFYTPAAATDGGSGFSGKALRYASPGDNLKGPAMPYCGVKCVGNATVTFTNAWRMESVINIGEVTMKWSDDVSHLVGAPPE